MGSKGGTARAEKLSPEQRKTIAANASRARWARVKEAKEKAAEAPPAPPIDLPAPELIPVAPEPVQAAPEPAPAPKRSARKAVPKEFGKAYSYADKRLALALKEWMDCFHKMPVLQEEISRLARVIQAFGGTVNPEALAIATRSPLLPSFAAPGAPTILQPVSDLPQMPPDGIDPALHRTNAVPVPGLPSPTAPIIPGAAMGGGMDLDYVPRDDEPPQRTKGGDGWV